MPSSNQRIETSPVKLVFLMMVGGVIQATRPASRAQKAAGSAAAAAVMALCCSAVTSAWSAMAGFTVISWVSDILGLPWRHAL